jgi:predicted RNA binding protein YcfA (HicA-like mRNA interferase family)
MGKTSFSGREIAKVLTVHGFEPTSRAGSHLKLRWESPDTEEVCLVTIPMKGADEISRGTTESIAEQSGANDFRGWCRWIDENR